MRKPELAAAIAEKADLTKEQANRVLNALLDEITGALNRKDSVTLVGFGTFLQRHRGARTGKNPQTGQPVRSRPATPSPSSRARPCATRSTDRREPGVRAAPGFVEDASALIERTAVVLLANSYNAPLISPDIEARA